MFLQISLLTENVQKLSEVLSCSNEHDTAVSFEIRFEQEPQFESVMYRSVEQSVGAEFHENVSLLGVTSANCTSVGEGLESTTYIIHCGKWHRHVLSAFSCTHTHAQLNMTSCLSLTNWHA